MQNGNAIALKRSILVTFILCCLSGFSQKKDSAVFNADYLSFKIDDECKTKSERTPKPTIIKITRAKLEEIKTVKELLRDIPEHCDVLCVFVSIKKQDDKVFEFRNIGNEMVYASRLAQGKYIIIESLATTCQTLHKANYKIQIE